MSSNPKTAVKSILPSPFDWCEIPAGKVKLTKRGSRPKGTTTVVPTFYIAKYPVTNAQYQLFIEAGGYENAQWWTEEGWQARAQDVNWDGASRSMKPTNIAWTAPRDWQNPLFNSADQPVINVSWYEAIAYCQWLSETSGEKIMLPTQEQWQRAAQGDRGYAYPWGAVWDPDRCNNNVAKHGIGRTTPVTHYEGKGDSPFGVVDMAGNTKEWILSEYYSGSNDLAGTNDRKLCSCFWMTEGSMSFRVDNVFQAPPYLRGNMFGFRIARE